MDALNLYIMDMSHADNTSGVDRYVGLLLKGLEAYPSISVHWIHLTHDKSMIFHREEHTVNYTKITIPLPQQYNEIIAERFWIRQYNEQVFRLTKHLFENKQNCILHLHTLNLIDLAVLIREHFSCKIITHLHCIPWKSYYNTNKQKFNELYQKVYMAKSRRILPVDFITNNCELESYTDADHVICVTRCAADFLKQVVDKQRNNLSVIPNGINDLACRETPITNRSDTPFKLLYVGVLIESKGLKFILEAMRKVKQQGYDISLTIAGKAIPALTQRLHDANNDLSLHFLGKVSFDELTHYYLNSDVGVIASLQEQSSYVAIEMAMFGLPVITTAVDGLDEIFTDHVNALKVDTRFSKITGLSVDVDMLADKLILLIENKALRMKLSKNIRVLYDEKHTLQQMLQQTVSVYYKTIGGQSI